MANGNLTLKEFWKLSESERCVRYAELSDHDKFGVRQGMDTGVISPPCNTCRHRIGISPACAAFPDGITGDHLRAMIENPQLECGNGYHFEEK